MRTVFEHETRQRIYSILDSTMVIATLVGWYILIHILIHFFINL